MLQLLEHCGVVGKNQNLDVSLNSYSMNLVRIPIAAPNPQSMGSNGHCRPQAQVNQEDIQLNNSAYACHHLLLRT